MDINDAFTTQAIELAGTDVDGEDETELRMMIRQVYQANDMVLTEGHENLAVHCFIAGRTYQEDMEVVWQIPMSRDLATQFMEFLTQRGVS